MDVLGAGEDQAQGVGAGGLFGARSLGAGDELISEGGPLVLFLC